MSLTLEKTWAVRLRATRKVAGILVTLARSQTVITGGELNKLRAVPIDMSAQGFTLWQTWAPTIPTDDNHTLSLTISFHGEPPVITAVTWAVEGELKKRKDLLLPEWVLECHIEEKGCCAALWERELSRIGIAVREVDVTLFGELVRTAPEDAKNVFKLRREALEDRASASAFFLDLDRATTPGLIDDQLTQAIGEVGYQLDARLRDRRATGAIGKVPLFDRIDADDLFDERAQLTTISDLLRGMIREHLTDPLRPDLVDWTFESFVTDLLAVAHQDEKAHAWLQTHGAPNGVAYFQFAELALLCIDNEIDAQFWMKHLPTFVRTAHVFAEHAPESSVPVSANPYPIDEVHYAYVPARYYPRERLHDLRARYQTKLRGKDPAAARAFLEDRLTWIVGHAVLPTPPLSGFLRTRPLKPDAQCDHLELGGVP